MSFSFVRRLALVAVALPLALSVQAQVVTGVVREAGNGQPIPFANIGLLRKAVGTVADEHGNFRLSTGKAVGTDSVRISSIGYRPLLLPLQQLAASPNVQLTAEAVTLRSVTVQGKNPYKRTRTLGINQAADNTPNPLSAADLGAQVGTVIQVKRRPVRVLSAHFNLAQTTAGTVTCRVNFYRLRADGWPTEEKLVDHDLLVTTPLRRGTVSLDLKNQQIVLDEDFLMAVELVKWTGPSEPGPGVAFATTAGPTSTSLYYRETSDATWKRTMLDALSVDKQPRVSFFVKVAE